jgi:hypothetical protein
MHVSPLARASTLARALLLALVAFAAAASPSFADAVADDAATIARDDAVPQAAAEARLRAQDASRGASAEAQRRWPQTYAGAWRDASGTLVVAFTRDAARNAAALGRGAAVAAATHPRSFASLRERQQQMIDDRRLAAAGLLLLAGADGGGYDLWIDEEANALVVRLDEASPAAAAAFKARYGQDVVVESGPTAEPEACDSRFACKYELRAGLEVYSSETICSSSFTVRRNDNDAKNLLSAAHCTGDWRYHDGVKYGEVQSQQFYGRVDAERHSTSQNGFTAKPWIFVDQDHKSRDVLTRGTYAETNQGDEVCKSGRTTYKTCGNVQSKTYSPGDDYMPNAHDMIKAGYCAKPGDSGAAVFLGNKAFGVHSGGTAGDCGPNDFSIFSHIEFVQEALNARVMLAPDS